MRYIVTISLIPLFILFVSACSSKENNIGPINLTANSEFFDGYPNLSPTKETLAFVSFR